MSDLPQPVTRKEVLLASIAGEDATLPEPVTREEKYLAKIAGEDVAAPESPVTRKEQYLAYIAEHGGGSVHATPTELDVTLTSALTVDVYLSQSEPNGVTLDWGDGSEPESAEALAAHFTHAYAAAGDQKILITAPSGVTWSPGNGTNTIVGNNATSSKANTNATLTAVVIGDGVDTFGDNSFGKCTALSRISFPSRLLCFSLSAFDGCTALKRVDIHDLRLWCQSYFPYSVTDSASYALQNVGNPLYPASAALYLDRKLLEDITIMPEFGPCAGAFAGCSSLRTVTFSEKTDTIGPAAFYRCTNLRSSNLLTSNIGDFAFYGDEAFTVSSLSFTAIGKAAFNSCIIAATELPKTLLYLGEGAFQFASFINGASPTLSVRTGTIPYSAFQYSNLISIKFYPDCRAVYADVVGNRSLLPFYGCSQLTIIYVAQLADRPDGWDSMFNYIGSDSANAVPVNYSSS